MNYIYEIELLLTLFLAVFWVFFRFSEPDQDETIQEKQPKNGHNRIWFNMPTIPKNA